MKGLIDPMKTDFYNHANSKQNQATASLSSLDYESALHCEQLEAKLRVAIEENAAVGNYAVAIALIDQLISLHPNSAMNYNNRGLMYFRNQQLAEAVTDLTQALAINPQLDSAYNNRANCYAALGDFAAAIADYDIALDLNPANIRAWINQGITFRDMGSYDLAIGNFDIAGIISNKFSERVYGERGRTYHLRGDWNCAVADYNKALKLLAEQPHLQLYQQKVTDWLDELLDPILAN
ncbi:MAG TPA: tetratricopeptide repeat protein [Xenococcaceae cyanobacterium]